MFKDWPKNQIFTWMSLSSLGEKEELQAHQAWLQLKRLQDHEGLSEDED
jgi:hypothetical protein